VTVKENSPDVGWPSLETTFQTTRYSPAGPEPVRGWVTIAPSTVGAPSITDSPAGSVTVSSVAPSPSMSLALNVRVSSAGRVSTLLSAAGDDDTRASWAEADSGEKRTRNAARRVAARAIGAAGRRRAVVFTSPAYESPVWDR